MRIVLMLLSVMLFVALAADFSPNSPSSPLPSAPSAENQTVDNDPVTPEETPRETSRDLPREEPAVIAISPAPLPEAEPAPAPKAAPAPAPAPDFEAEVEREIVRLTNIEREKEGLGALTSNTTLASVADGHSADMLARDFFDHNNPDGCSSSCRTTAGGYSWRMVGENIFMMEGWDLTPLEAAIMIVNGWMSSTGHRANILKDGYTETGIGVEVEGEAVYATALYAKPR
jgi:uncharacterized protein YkwD